MIDYSDVGSFSGNILKTNKYHKPLPIRTPTAARTATTCVHIPWRNSGAYEFDEMIPEGLEIQRSDRRESGLPHAALRNFNFIAHMWDAHGVRPDFDHLGGLDDVSRTLMAICAADPDFLGLDLGLLAWPEYRSEELTYRL
ncbi:MAG: hypothetical protein OEU09_07250 [Rhodospirillales bacterium]|nr:hypothetical protein [Rhodospirillales bacterium]MDH3911079.1 hypothetical protein [Rhodospirillales bacterium]MDH3918216.1 hypothetical protein [Rhodospirillales bacterium]MDH3966594.1 hypothetical protein [Rhodospirillales bacterium]